jgi:hypothetical protein
MPNSSRNIKIDSDCVTNFKKMAEDLHLRAAQWAGFFVQYELDFLKRDFMYFSKNTDLAYKYLTQKHKNENSLKKYSIRMNQELIDTLTAWCKEYKIDKAMFVEYALKSAYERVGVTSDSAKERNIKRHELMPLYLLEHSFKERLTFNQRRNVFRERLLIKDDLIPDDFKREMNVKVDGRRKSTKK